MLAALGDQLRRGLGGAGATTHLVKRSPHGGSVWLHDLLLPPPQAQRCQDRSVVLSGSGQAALECHDERADGSLHALRKIKRGKRSANAKLHALP